MTEPHPNSGIEIGEIIRKIWTQKILVLTITVLGSSIALVYVLLAITFYDTAMKLVFQTPSQNMTGSISALAAMAGVNTSNGDPSAYAGDIVTSNAMLSLVLDHPWRVSKGVTDTSKPIYLLELWKLDIDSTQPNWKASLRNSLLEKLRGEGYISYSTDKKSGISTLKTSFEDPLVTFEINQFLYSELNNILVNKMSYKARENRKFIEERLTKVTTELESNENELKDFRETHRLRLDPESQLQETRLERKADLNQQLFIQLEKQCEDAKIEEAKNIPILDVIDAPLLPTKKSRPQRTIMLLTGIMFSFVFAVCAAYVLSTFQGRKKVLGKTQ